MTENVFNRDKQNKRKFNADLINNYKTKFPFRINSSNHFTNFTIPTSISIDSLKRRQRYVLTNR